MITDRSSGLFIDWKTEDDIQITVIVAASYLIGYTQVWRFGGIEWLVLVQPDFMALT